MLYEFTASPPAQRQSLADFFREFADLPVEFLQYDNGYRSWRYTYTQVGCAACGFAARLRAEGIGKDDKVIFLVRLPDPASVVCADGTTSFPSSTACSGVGDA